MNNRRLGVYAAYAVLLFVILPFGYFYLVRGMRFFAVPSESMVPTLNIADYLVTFPETSYHPGDVVVLHDPDLPGQYIVKRIVALEDDVVRAGDGALFVNGRYISEPYLREPIAYTMPEYTVPAGAAFVLGDNRNESQDSHNWNRDPKDPRDQGRPQALPLAEIVGKVSAIYLPFDRIRRIKSYPLEELAAR